MENAFFVNGVFETVFDEILRAQNTLGASFCYLQPYSSGRMVYLAKSQPNEEKPIRLLASLTTSLNLVSHEAEVVGWEDKRELMKDPDRLLYLNERIIQFQPKENEVYLQLDDGKTPINFLSIRNLKKLDSPFTTSSLIKASNGRPLEHRSRAGGWSKVLNPPEWSGKLTSRFEEELDADLQKEVKKSLASSATNRRKRLKESSPKPKQVQVISKAYIRNADVIAEVLHRASGICEECGRDAPFTRASNLTPYLEVHHIIPLSENGEDTVANAIALCPNCHREAHFGV